MPGSVDRREGSFQREVGIVGIVVGMAAEARIAERLGWPVGIGGGTSAGARVAALHLVEQSVRGLVSIGLAGGLDPSLRPGAVLVPEAVTSMGELYPCQPLLAQALGGMTPHRLLGANRPIAEPAEKLRLWRETDCVAVDLESGPIAEIAASRGMGFAALRVICDPAQRPVPQAALVALTAEGTLALWPTLASLIRNPGQLPALLALARDAAIARRALVDRLTAIQRAAARRPAT